MSSTNENSFSKNSADSNGRKTDFEKGIKDIGKMGGELASDLAHKVQSQAGRYYDEGLNQVKKLETRIQNHPMQSFLIVAGVGLILGALWARR